MTRKELLNEANLFIQEKTQDVNDGIFKTPILNHRLKELRFNFNKYGDIQCVCGDNIALLSFAKDEIMGIRLNLNDIIYPFSNLKGAIVLMATKMFD